MPSCPESPSFALPVPLTVSSCAYAHDPDNSWYDRDQGGCSPSGAAPNLLRLDGAHARSTTAEVKTASLRAPQKTKLLGNLRATSASSALSLLFLQRAPDALGRGGHVEMFDTQRVDDGAHHGRQRAHRTRLAATLGTQRMCGA